jgi:CRISPR/Cas system endoribonuclease Cas6 (RAMP superfamily)
MTVDERRMAVLAKVKANLVIEHGADDSILSMHVQAAMDYAGKFQHKDNSYYSTHDMSPTTTQAVVMHASFYYESKDGGTGGFFSSSPSAAKQTNDCVNNLLRLDKDWKV